MNVLGFCAGIGGLELGLGWATGHAARPVCLVEREAFCCSVLAARMADGHFPAAPIFTDLKTFDARPWRGLVDCITAGWPCQPFSGAGKRRGKDDPRHLWPYIANHIATIEPTFFFGENVPGHLTLGFDQVCEDLSAMGYTIEAGIFSAEECGAPHRRERLFVFAHTNSPALRHPKKPGEGCTLQAEPGNHGDQGDVAHANGFSGRKSRSKSAVFVGGDGSPGGGSAWFPFARVDQPFDGPAHVVDRHIAAGWGPDWEKGVPRTTSTKEHRINRLRALGNAVVPIVAAKAWLTLTAQAGLAESIPRPATDSLGLGDTHG